MVRASEIGPKVRIRFVDTIRVSNGTAGRAGGENSEGHRHSVVVVGIEHGRLRFPRYDRYVIWTFLRGDASLA